jgi:hypothetical protein
MGFADLKTFKMLYIQNSISIQKSSGLRLLGIFPLSQLTTCERVVGWLVVVVGYRYNLVLKLESPSRMCMCVYVCAFCLKKS